jgi:hypothetical protein
MRVKPLGIDEDKLLKAIGKFEVETNQQSYLFMNLNTMELLKKQSCPNPTIPEVLITEYLGRRVYEDDRLDIGEIEIR